MNEEDFKPHDTVGGIIKNDKGEIFTLYHHKYNLYSLPIGKTIKDEPPNLSLIREIKEELGINVQQMELIGSGHIKYKLNDINIESVGILFEISLYDGIISNMEPDKHSNFKFIPITELQKLRDENKVTELTRVYLKYLNK